MVPFHWKYYKCEKMHLAYLVFEQPMLSGTSYIAFFKSKFLKLLNFFLIRVLKLKNVESL